MSDNARDGRSAAMSDNVRDGRSMFDAVLIAGFGGPEGMDQVPDFLRRASGGHVPQDRLAEVGTHYAHFGGVSPVNAQHRELARELATRLAMQGIDLPVVTANRHSPPFIPDTLAELAERGSADLQRRLDAVARVVPGATNARHLPAGPEIAHAHFRIGLEPAAGEHDGIRTDVLVASGTERGDAGDLTLAVLD
jgi:hypothetical protein